MPPKSTIKTKQSPLFGPRVSMLAGLLLMLWLPSASAQDTKTLSGTVFSAQDSTPIFGVTVNIPAIGSVVRTNPGGQFSFENLPRQAHSVVFIRVGLVPDTVRIEADVITLTVYLHSRAVQLAPIIATEAEPARERFDQVAQTSTVSLGPAEIINIPGLAEPDVLRVVGLLPGVIQKNDFSVGFNVRGGEADQNLIQLDGVTIFNPSHLGGLFSTFDANAVEEMEFITGGFPAGYGGRLSSVLDVQLKRGSIGETRVKGQVSLLSSKILIEGPLPKQDVSYMLGARRTYADVLVRALSKEELPYYFTDAFAKVTYPFGTSNTLAVTGYWGRDALDFPFSDEEEDREALDFRLAWGNQLLGAKWNSYANGKLFTFRASVTGFDAEAGIEPDLIRLENRVTLWSAGVDVALSAGKPHDVQVGVGVDNYDITYDFRSRSLDAVFAEQSYHPRVWSAYVDDQWSPTDWLYIRPGIRVEHVEGADFTGFAPRAAFKLFLAHDLALTGSTGRYYQALHSLRDHNAPWSIFDFWVAADDVTPVARSDHMVLGFEKWFGSRLSLTVEGYRKTFDNLITFNYEDDNKVRGDEYLTVNGDAHGVDVMLRKYTGGVRGWIAYAYLKANRFGEGQHFPPAHDRRHSFDIVLQTRGPLGSEMGVRWGIGSPLPYTGFSGEWQHRQYSLGSGQFDEFEEEPLALSQLNTERYPTYQRMDISFRWRTEKWGGILTPYLQFVNVSNRKNIFLYAFDFGGTPATRSGITQFPFLPSFGVEFEF